MKVTIDNNKLFLEYLVLIYLMYTGFDSKLIAYEVREPLRLPPEGVPYEHFEPIQPSKDYKKVFKFLLGASVTVRDKKRFKDAYIESIQDSLRLQGFEPKTKIYNSTSLVSETGYRMTEIIPHMISQLDSEIERVVLYCAWYIHPMAIYAESQPTTMLPIQFLNHISPSFPHICASKYVRMHGESQLELDHFDLGTTPAWDHLINTKCNIKIYFSGDICNPLISIADLIVRLIEERMSDSVDEVSLLKSLTKGCETISKKVFCYNLGGSVEEKRFATPRTRLPANLNALISHPIIFTLGQWPEQFITTPLFERIKERALDQDGCIKKYEPIDQKQWDAKQDVIVVLEEEEREKILRLKLFGREIPKLLSPSDILL